VPSIDWKAAIVELNQDDWDVHIYFGGHNAPPINPDPHRPNTRRTVILRRFTYEMGNLGDTHTFDLAGLLASDDLLGFLHIES
jgi:hypothetical protein